MVKKLGLLAFLFYFIGVPSQVKDSTYSNVAISYENENIQRFHFKKLYIPGALMVSGLFLNGNSQEALKNEIVEERNEHLINFRSHIDDVLQFSPIIAAYALDFFGVRSKTDFNNRTVILLKGEILTLGSVFIMKNLTHVTRPDGSDDRSFPSGHTAQAFAAATFLSEEYKEKLPWMPYAAYGVAGTVGVFRMVNNKHYISDVFFGAGLGLLSMKLSYWMHQYKWNKKQRDETSFKAYLKNEALEY